jgi:hypothetical protein
MIYQTDNLSLIFTMQEYPELISQCIQPHGCALIQVRDLGGWTMLSVKLYLNVKLVLSFILFRKGKRKLLLSFRKSTWFFYKP